MQGALSGVKVLELGQWIAAPYCCAILADLGADVIKIERPRTGDDQRHSPPHVDGMGVYFRHLNRNKRSVSLDLANIEDRDFLCSLLREADVVVQNLRPGSLKKLGLGYADVKALNPKLVYCSISGFGGTGPLSSLAAFDLIAQAASGLMSITTPVKGRPAKLPLPIADVPTGLNAAVGVLAALLSARVSGYGQEVDVSLLESALSMAPLEVAEYLGAKALPQPVGEGARNSAPYGVFRTADGALVLAASNQSLWTKLCWALNCEPLVEKPEYKTNELRVRHQSTLNSVLDEVFLTDSTEAWLVKLAVAGIPSGPVWNYAQILDHEHMEHRGLIEEVALSDGHRIRQMLAPLTLSRTPVELRTSAPTLGQHTAEVRAAMWGPAAEN